MVLKEWISQCGFFSTGRLKAIFPKSLHLSSSEVISILRLWLRLCELECGASVSVSHGKEASFDSVSTIVNYGGPNWCWRLGLPLSTELHKYLGNLY